MAETTVSRRAICEISLGPKKDGAGEGTRTPDPIITNDVLYQLSYTGILLASWAVMALRSLHLVRPGQSWPDTSVEGDPGASLKPRLAALQERLAA